MSCTVGTKKNMTMQICLMGLLLAVLSGCARQNKTIDLYVDAQALSNRGENERAIEKLNQATKIDDQFALAYSLLGDIHQKTDNYDMSVWAYKRAIELNPWSSKDYLGLGELYQNNAEYKRAIAVYSKAADADSQNFEIHYRTAICYYELKDYEGAEQAANMLAMKPYPGFKGEYFEMPCRNIIPKPKQKPHPPMWMACSRRETIRQNSLASSASRRYSCMT